MSFYSEEKCRNFETFRIEKTSFNYVNYIKYELYKTSYFIYFTHLDELFSIRTKLTAIASHLTMAPRCD